ncbi:ABC1 kinase family protein [Halorientalis pallida]|uniref:AarF/ABC1/UbiB kinase family protein n=1 Tax=Halorientalis pallida TaxID=2479928 RepID=A0A498KT68_9EURY|nr:AarF/ABC1/UbiB kinase family protein [Halorientalis pallida]RXK47234.1 AarF/ABC1/UbiB kinase family protein [Halorientalis pallida]
MADSDAEATPDASARSRSAPGSDGTATDDGGPSASGDDRTAGGTTADSWLRLRVAWRLLVVVRQFLPLVLAYARDRRRFLLFGRERQVDPETQVDRAEELLDTLVALGPTFIKVGQILSTRPDVLPGPYIVVLQRLQDRVPAAAWDEIEPILEAELGPVDEAFDTFDTEPISGASLGQVYTARLDGQRVAVKVLRPNIRRRVAADLRVIETLTPLLIRGAEPGQAFTLENLADEFSATIREEMDYVHEARMLRTVRQNFADEARIRVPEPIDSHSGSRVLTMEYVEGTKITDVDRLDAMGVDRQALVERLFQAYIEMVLEDGVFHADPHPGNLAVQADGTIVFYDFGITGTVDERLQSQIFDFYVSIARDDVDGIIDSFVAMGALDPTADRRLLREMFEIVIESFRGRDVDQYRVQQLVADFQAELYEFPLRLPQDLALIVRITTVLEGVCRTLDPEFDLIELVTEYVRSEGYASRGVRELLDRAGDELRATTEALLVTGPKLERTLDRANRDDLTVRTALGDENGLFDRLAKQAVLGLGFVGSVFAALVLFVAGDRTAATVAALGAPVALALLYLSLRKRSGISAEPQFTRQNLRAREGGDGGQREEAGYATAYGDIDGDGPE